MGTGVAEAMLKRLVEKAGNRHPFPLLLADATNLPLDDGSRRCGHGLSRPDLIPAWRAAVDEAIRVLEPRGVLLVDFGGTPPAPWHDWSQTLFRERGIARILPGVSEPEDLSGYLGEEVRTRSLPP
jgi:ubiquinone/menaquinone biosynthesis C-methylase UbiE